MLLHWQLLRLFIAVYTTVLSLKLLTGWEIDPVVFNTSIKMLPGVRGGVTG